MNWRGQQVTITQQTRYPWDGQVTLRLKMDRPDTFGLKLRLPGWCRSAQVWVNGQVLNTSGLVERGYLRLLREWQPDDEVVLELAMPVERVYANPNVRQNTGRVALQRGPVVYCIEGADHELPVHQISLPRSAELAVQFEPDLLDGVVVITGTAHAADEAKWQGNLYRANPTETCQTPLKAIPYFAWDNRAPGAMQVWLPEI